MADRLAATGIDTAQALQRVASLNAAYHAFSYLREAAAAEAAHLEGKNPAGPLGGWPASVKGCLPVAGLPWTEGSGAFADRVAAHDARIVTQLRAAGAVVLGTTTLSELAIYGVVNEFEPMGQNPWDPGRTAGGSSTGAGVAASLGMGRIHVGTDSGGSVRNPACHCGVVGFTPGLGLLSHEGGTNRAPSLNAVGLLAGNVADVATAFRALAPQGGSPSVRRRLVVPRRLTEQSCDDETLVLFEQALARARDAGFECIDAEIDAWDAGQRGAGTISTYESALSLAATDLSRVSRSTRGRIAKAEALTSADISAAAAAAAALRRAVDATLAACAADAIATPTWPFAAPLIEADEVEVQGRKVPLDVYRHIFVRPANAITGCAISLPMGLYPTARVPAGLHLLAMGGAEATLLSVAGAIEAVLPPIGKPPPLR